MIKYDPKQHITGKVYDLTQENMNAMLDEIRRLTTKLHYADVYIAHLEAKVEGRPDPTKDDE